MRESWKKLRIEDIITGLYDGPHATPKPSDEGPVFFGIKNLTDDGRLDLSEIRHIAENDFPRWTKRVLPQKDDIVFTYEATLHRYGLIPEGLRCCLGRRMALIRVDQSKADPKFLLYYFRSSEWRQTMEQNLLIGATVNRIPIGDFPKFPLKLPPIQEQRNISRILNALDSKISLNNRINAELEALAKTIYDYWFVQFDFPTSAAQAAEMGNPELEGRPYKSSGGAMVWNEDLKREVPKGWEVKKLSDVARLKAGGDKPKVLSTQKTDECQIPIFSNGVTYEGLYGFTDQPKITEPSITISARGTIGYSVLRTSPFVPIIRLIVVTPNNEDAIKFFAEYLKRADYERSGSVQRQLTVPQISKVDILYPPKELLSKFSEATSSGIKQIDLLKEQNQELASLRDWLLPMLMNGQVEVGEALKEYEMEGEEGIAEAELIKYKSDKRL